MVLVSEDVDGEIVRNSFSGGNVTKLFFSFITDRRYSSFSGSSTLARKARAGIHEATCDNQSNLKSRIL
jgi:hypothetical protein